MSLDRPISQVIPALLSVVLPILWMTLASAGIGGIVLLPVRGRWLYFSALLEFVLAYFLGQALLATAFLGFALVGQLRFVEVTASLTIGSIGFVIYLWRTAAFAAVRNVGVRRLGIALPLPWILLTVAAAAVTLLGFTTIGGTVAGDAIAYYMVVPKLVAYSGQLNVLPGYESFSVGLAAEMLLAALTCLGMPGVTPRIFSWFNFLPMTVLIVGLAGQCGMTVRGKILAVTIPLTSSAVLVLWGSGKTDLFAVGPALCAVVFALASWEESGKKIAVALSGLFAGFAVLFKLSYMLPLVPALVLMIIWRDLFHFWQHRRDDMRRSALILMRSNSGTALSFSLAFVSGVAPFVVQSLVLYGSIAGPKLETTAWFSPGTTLRLVFTYPFALTYGRYWAQYGTLSPLVIGLLPLLIYFPRLRDWGASQLAALSVGAVTGLIAWIALLPSVFMPRYFLINLLLLGIPAAAAGEAFSQRGRWPSNTVVLASLAALAAIPAQVDAQEGASFGGTSTARILREPNDDLLVAGGLAPYARAHHALNAVAAPGDRIFLLTYYRYWLRPDLLMRVNTNAELRPFALAKQPSESLCRSFWTNFRRGGYHFILLDARLIAIGKYLLDHIPPGMTAHVVFSDGALTAYEMTPIEQTEQLSSGQPAGC